MNKADFNKDWMTKGITESAVTFAEAFGKFLCNPFQDQKTQQWKAGNNAMTTSQIRNIYGEIKRIQAKGFDKEKASFLLLRPKLAYAEARVTAKSRESRIIAFREIIEKAHQHVTEEKHYQNFVDFFEATLAYHKYYGGKD
jgi:CRISPR-associated protein Csm2